MKPFRVGAALMLAALAAGCSGGGNGGTMTDPPPPVIPVVGNYGLVTVNGFPLPVVLFDDEFGVLEIVSGILILNADLTFTDATTFRETVDGEVTTETVIATGTYSRAGNTVTFRPTEGEDYTMTFDGQAGRLTQIFLGLVIVYQR